MTSRRTTALIRQPRDGETAAAASRRCHRPPLRRHDTGDPRAPVRSSRKNDEHDAPAGRADVCRAVRSSGFAVCSLKFEVCSSRFAVRGLQFAVCYSPSTVCPPTSTIGSSALVIRTVPYKYIQLTSSENGCALRMHSWVGRCFLCRGRIRWGLRWRGLVGSGNELFKFDNQNQIRAFLKVHFSPLGDIFINGRLFRFSLKLRNWIFASCGIHTYF